MVTQPLDFPVISAAPAVTGDPQIFALALPSGHRGLKERAVWIYEVEEGRIARQIVVTLDDARWLLAAASNPNLAGALLFGRDDPIALGKALLGAIQTFELAETLARADRAQPERTIS